MLLDVPTASPVLRERLFVRGVLGAQRCSPTGRQSQGSGVLRWGQGYDGTLVGSITARLAETPEVLGWPYPRHGAKAWVADSHAGARSVSVPPAGASRSASGCPFSAAVLGTQRAEAQMRGVGDSGRVPSCRTVESNSWRHGSGEPIPAPKDVSLTADFTCVGNVRLVKTDTRPFSFVYSVFTPCSCEKA